MTYQQQIDRLIKALMVYKAYHYPLDLTETEIEIVIDALKTKKSLCEYMAWMEDDRR
jgi:hypothetical protein